MQVPVIVLLSILLFVLLLLTLPVRFVVLYRETVTLKLRILCFSFSLFPKAKKVRLRRYTAKGIKKREARAARKAKKRRAHALKKAAKHKKQQKETKPTKKHTLKENLVLVRALCAALIRKTHRHLHLSAARLHVRVATGDAATTAILYGAVSASLSYLLAALDRAVDLRSKPHDVSVFADYLSEKSSADIKLVFSINAAGALALVFSAVLTLFKSKFSRTRRKNQAKKAKA